MSAAAEEFSPRYFFFHHISILSLFYRLNFLAVRVLQPLARLGASVTGVDASQENIKNAQWHAAHDPQVARNIRYRAGTVESLVEKEAESYDAVVASEIIEHVADASLFVSACCKLLRVRVLTPSR